jgi:peptidoglycan hydrolase-like protein with peptidoglycan-binding domain
MMQDLPLLKKGASGEHVQTLQGLLVARSHPEIEIDGKFDDEVEKAVKAVQKWGGVTADGEVGPQTWPVLLRVA